MTMSWLMPIEFEPALIACVVSPADLSYAALTATKECVIAIPGVDLIKKVVDVGNCSGKDADKFKKFKLTPLPAKKVSAPLVGECLNNIECKVVDASMADKYAMFILKAVKAWANPGRKERRIFHAVGDGTFSVDGRKINLKKRMIKFQSLL
jgi:flavin reductase (DIM6/NTAB) family NADH-FMN oxidoreductase RutF